MRIYEFNLEKHILPRLGKLSLRGIDRAAIESCLSELKLKGHATSTIRNVRATFSTVLQAATERGYIEKNPAHGIRIREGDTIKKDRRFYSAATMRMLLDVLGACRSVVSIAVLTGMRIGEILALRWKRVDLLRSTIEVAETYSAGGVGPPKTKSSRRTIPISSFVRSILENHRVCSGPSGTDDLVFKTPSGTPQTRTTCTTDS